MDSESIDLLDNPPGPLGLCAFCLAEDEIVKAASLVNGTSQCDGHARGTVMQLRETAEEIEQSLAGIDQRFSAATRGRQ